MRHLHQRGRTGGDGTQERLQPAADRPEYAGDKRLRAAGAAALLKRGQFKDHSSCRDDRFGQLRRGGTAGARFFGQSFQAVLDFRADGGNRPICNEREGVSKCAPSFFMNKAPTFTSRGFVIT